MDKQYDPKMVQGAVFKSWRATTEQEREQFRLYVKSLKSTTTERTIENEPRRTETS